ncbi:MAG: N-acetylmuramoyl-L-alanine amidase [Kiritimatiellae bacterium]|nr:N-acetylmuramoyl-L-alanine amidase [Kiritimatiellia bacterium]
MSPCNISGVLKTLAMWVALSAPLCAGALSFSNRYRSPRNPERPIRKSTRLIVLHTTEAGARSSLNKLSERGEAHYCIDEKGVVHRIVDRDREAFHAGRSMWCGREECDDHSIGIEVVGYHNKPVTLAQLDAIRELVAVLKKEYRLKDTQVVCHSHVAYGAPNKWQKRNHRGRKRCGMLFAMPSVRQRLDLKSKPAYDPDVRAKRLVVGDPYLEKVLYGNVDTMVGKLGRNVAPETPTFFSSLFKKNPPDKSSEAGKENYYAKPPFTGGQKVKASAPKKKQQFMSAKASKKPVSRSEPKTIRDLDDKSNFRELGVLGQKKGPYAVAGKNWNSKNTFYYIKGRIIRGDRLDPRKAPVGARVFIRK